MEKNSNQFDVVIIGAGTGGTTAARFLSKQGFKVCLVDRKPKEQIGQKICGDAVGTEIFEFLKIKPPTGNELSCHVKGAKLYSPNLKKCIELIDPTQAGFIVNRLEFGQRLLNEALDSGVTQFLDNTIALNLLYKKDQVIGVKLRLNNGEKIDLKSKIIIDSSGVHSPLKKSSKSSLIEKQLDDKDFILCYREIVDFSQSELKVPDPEYISIYLNEEKAPGGYIWYFPKNESAVNIGVGVYPFYKGKVKEFYKKYVFDEFIKTNKYKIISSGGGIVPVRRPLWSCAENGLIYVGDSACQVNPLHGGGIDPSMRAGYYASLITSKALEKGDFSLNTLWEYNFKVMTTFGAQFAALDLLRMVLQVLTNDDLNFGLEKDLLNGNEILEISSTGGLNLSLMGMIQKAIRGISRPDLLLDLNFLRIKMKEISKIYRKFPMNLSQFENWKRKVTDIYNEVKKMLINTKENKLLIMIK